MGILVVDDSKTIRHIMKRTLEGFGYSDIVLAENYDEAVAYMAEVTPDLILSDLMMPQKDGVDLLKYVRASHGRLADVPFMMVSAVGSKKKIVEAVQAGLQYYMIKPINPDTLFEKISKLAKKYGFPPPEKKNTKPVWQSTADEPEAAEVQGGGLSEEQRKDVIDHFELVLGGELSIEDFTEFLGRDYADQGGAALFAKIRPKLLDCVSSEL